jgi:hypothetical protein
MDTVRTRLGALATTMRRVGLRLGTGGSSWRHGSHGRRAWAVWLTAAWAGLTAAAGTQAQSIDTGLARATVGQALQLVLRVRDFEASPAGLGRDCVRAEVRQGSDAGPHQPLAWTATARAVDGETWVTLSDPQAVREPLLHVRVALVCGAPYTREFTLLADAPAPAAAVKAGSPPRPARPRATPAPPVRPLAEARPSAEPPSANPAQGPAQSFTQSFTQSSTQSLAQSPAQRLAAADPHPLAVRMTPTPHPSARAELGPAPTTSASPLSDAFLQLWHQDMRALHDEQRQSRALLASLSARLERAEREATQLGALVAAVVIGLATLSAGARLWHQGHRPWRRQARAATLAAGSFPPHAAATPSRSLTAPRIEPTLDAGAVAGDAPGARSRTGADAMSGATSAALATTTTGALHATNTARTAHPTQTAQPIAPDGADEALHRFTPEGGFSQATLDEGRHAELLAQVDQMAAEGYLGASVAVLENALQGRVGKSPGILLRLLDHYAALHQPWNRDRVATELTSLYNVALPELPTAAGAAAPDEGASIEDTGLTWSAIAASWSTLHAAATLAQALVRPSPHPPLPLAAFREALWLHALSGERGPLEPTPQTQTQAQAQAQAQTSGSAGDRAWGTQRAGPAYAAHTAYAVDTADTEPDESEPAWTLAPVGP